MANKHADESGTARFAVFRARDACSVGQANIMSSEPMTAVESAGSERTVAAGAHQGDDLRVLFSTPGFSLVYAWFKSGFPLPRHAHNVDCLYYIVGGSLRLGDQELNVGDGFFIGHDVPYTYTPGPEGVEVLEFRASDSFNVTVLANNTAFWDRAVEAIQQHGVNWKRECRPSPVMNTAQPDTH